jgi:hypothetical protein
MKAVRAGLAAIVCTSLGRRLATLVQQARPGGEREVTFSSVFRVHLSAEHVMNQWLPKSPKDSTPGAWLYVQSFRVSNSS